MTGWHYLSQEKRNIEEGDDTLFPLNRLKYELRNDFVVALQLSRLKLHRAGRP